MLHLQKMYFMARKNQVWATLKEEIYDQVDKMAKSERRPVTQMVAILIENAIKERQRKKKGSKDE